MMPPAVFFFLQAAVAAYCCLLLPLRELYPAGNSFEPAIFGEYKNNIHARFSIGGVGSARFGCS